MANRTPETTGAYEKMDDKLLHSAALVDKDGREVPITPEMINEACEKLAQKADQFYQQHAEEAENS